MADTPQDMEFTYTFENFFHPFVGELIGKLNKESLSGMLDPAYHEELKQKALPANTPDILAPNSFFKIFKEFYERPANMDLDLAEGFPKDIDLREGGPYANYNWELLFHIPLTIAVHLSKSQRFAEAQHWFHYIFDPTCNDTSIPTPKRFWKFLAFRQNKDVTQIDELLMLLSEFNPNDAEQVRLRNTILNGFEAIKNKPFQPHTVARTRHLAYQYCVVMKYLDNLIAWGDSLFRQDTIESINEATQRYVLAANILGARPQRIPPSGMRRSRTFKELKDRGLDEMGNALVELEGKLPFNLGLSSTHSNPTEATEPLFGIGRTLYFCIPRNEKMLGYWDIVADRLFKIRHCMNIEGVVRQLALFDPPLDPGMLVKAAAAGINIGSIVSGLNQPIGPVRSLLMIQKALELCSEVRGLGSALLSALEKGDGEHLAMLRQGHEIKIQQMQQDVRFLQWKQAQESTESLLRSRASAVERYTFYLRLLGQAPDPNSVPATFSLDRRELTEENFDEAYGALVGQYDKTIAAQGYPKLTIRGGTSPANQSGASGQGKLYMNVNEDADLNEHAPSARDFRLAATVNDTIYQGLAILPDFTVAVEWWGIGGNFTFGGSTFAAVGQTISSLLNAKASNEESQGASASKTASYERRADDWILQSNLAARELTQIGRQILGSLIAEQIAHYEYINIQKQIEHSQEVDQFLREKFTNEELYTWMQGEISRLYYEYYRFAFDTARKAEQTMKRELMRREVEDTDYVKFNYWDGGRKGLLSGEALYLDVKRMEMAYHENNKREFELTKHISLRQLNPLALLTLKAKGACEVTLPEWVYDMDGPGHYMRRIKNVNLTIPSVAGPYTSVNCTLTLIKSSLRKSPLLKDNEYARQGSDDDRFVDYYGAIQSMVTSSGNNDSGMFETNLRDERPLPFEGAGVESTWKLELPTKFRQFDYETISDVVFQVRYTARQGGGQLKDKSVDQIENLVTDVNVAGLALLFSLKHDFPTEWHRFVTGTGDFQTQIERFHFPYFLEGKDVEIKSLELLDDKLQKITPAGIDYTDMSTKINNGDPAPINLPDDPNVLKKDAEVFMLIRYSVA